MKIEEFYKAAIEQYVNAHPNVETKVVIDVLSEAFGVTSNVISGHISDVVKRIGSVNQVKTAKGSYLF
jgi:cytoplasmic iron level regulating protein YaaA (DUF328/UPF0246 family)